MIYSPCVKTQKLYKKKKKKTYFEVADQSQMIENNLLTITAFGADQSQMIENYPPTL